MQIEEIDLIHDEVEWVNRQNKRLDKAIPKKIRNIKTKILIVLITIFVIIKFYKIAILLLFLGINSYIKFKRSKLSIHFEIEPTYLFAVALTLKFGLAYGIAFIFSREIIASIARFNRLMVLDIVTKVAVILTANIMWRNVKMNLTVPLLAIIFIFEIITFFIKVKLGNSKYEAISAVSSHFFFRWVYFSIFLYPLIGIL